MFFFFLFSHFLSQTRSHSMDFRQPLKRKRKKWKRSKTREGNTLQSGQEALPAGNFTILKPRNPSFDVSELRKYIADRRIFGSKFVKVELFISWAQYTLTSILLLLNYLLFKVCAFGYFSPFSSICWLRFLKGGIQLVKWFSRPNKQSSKKMIFYCFYTLLPRVQHALEKCLQVVKALGEKAIMEGGKKRNRQLELGEGVPKIKRALDCLMKRGK